MKINDFERCHFLLLIPLGVTPHRGPGLANRLLASFPLVCKQPDQPVNLGVTCIQHFDSRQPLVALQTGITATNQHQPKFFMMLGLAPISYHHREPDQSCITYQDFKSLCFKPHEHQICTFLALTGHYFNENTIKNAGTKTKT